MQTDAQKISKMNKKFAFARFHQNGKFVQRISLIAYFVKFLMQMDVLIILIYYFFLQEW